MDIKNMFKNFIIKTKKGVNINPTILKDQEEYIEKSQKKLKENLEKANQETKKRYSNIQNKLIK